jgi:hypothetical protein
MPSILPQLNVRVRPEVVERLDALRAALAAERGHPVSQADAIAFAVTKAAATARKKKEKKS